jgi:hypothetical protein
VNEAPSGGGRRDEERPIGLGRSRPAVPYRAVGGLAARASGARRPLTDMDVHAPFDLTADLLQEARPLVTWGRSIGWNLGYNPLEGRSPRATDRARRLLGRSPVFQRQGRGRWEKQRADLANATNVGIFGAEIEVVPKDALIRYRSPLGREVNLFDVGRMMEAAPGEG